MKDNNLIFIVGQPRAGSTMLQAILSNHSKVDTISEPWILLPFLSIFNPSMIHAKYDYNLAVDAFFDFQEKTKNGNTSFKEEYKCFILKQYEKIRTGQENFVLDKTPRYYEIFNIIYEFFPSARFIILKRHPIAVLKSIMKTWNRFTFFDLSQYHERDIFVSPFLLLKWEKEYREKSNVKIVKYEDLIDNPEGHIKDLLNWLDIEYSKDILKYANNKSFHGKYGDPVGVKKASSPKKENVNQWKEVLNDKKYGKILKGYGHFLGEEFLKNYGYDEKMNFNSNLKFKLFKYYCFRKKFLSNSTLKDNLASIIIQKYFKEKI